MKTSCLNLAASATFGQNTLRDFEVVCIPNNPVLALRPVRKHVLGEYLT